MSVKGAVRRVVLRGEMVCIDGEVIASSGYGKHVSQLCSSRSNRKVVPSSPSTTAFNTAAAAGATKRVLPASVVLTSPGNAVVANQVTSPILKLKPAPTIRLSNHLRSAASEGMNRCITLTTFIIFTVFRKVNSRKM